MKNRTRLQMLKKYASRMLLLPATLVRWSAEGAMYRYATGDVTAALAQRDHVPVKGRSKGTSRRRVNERQRSRRPLPGFSAAKRSVGTWQPKGTVRP